LGRAKKPIYHSEFSYLTEQPKRRTKLTIWCKNGKPGGLDLSRGGLDRDSRSRHF
jgi:hypothetical protein